MAQEQLRFEQFASVLPRDPTNFRSTTVQFIQRECDITSQIKVEHEQMQAEKLTTTGLSNKKEITPPPPSWSDVEKKMKQEQMEMRRQNQHQVQHHNLWNQPQPHHQRRLFQQEQPPSWASTVPEQPQQQAQNCSDEFNDIFSTMTAWAGDPSLPQTRHRYQQQQHQHQQNFGHYGQQYGHHGQYQGRGGGGHGHFNQPAPLPAGGDVFSNIGEWSSAPRSPPKQRVGTMVMDLMAPTPPPTFQPHPAFAQSLSPATSSMTSSEVPVEEEPNSWKSLTMLLNQKSSRSPSLASARTKSPTEAFGQWASNL